MRLRFVTQSCPALLCPQGLQPARLLRPQDFLGENTGVGCQVLLQGIPSQGLNPSLLHWQVGSLLPSRLEAPAVSTPQSGSYCF